MTFISESTTAVITNPDPVHTVLTELGSTTLHVKTPCAIEVVSGRVITTLPFTGIGVIGVIKKSRVADELTSLGVLLTDTVPRVAA